MNKDKKAGAVFWGGIVAAFEILICMGLVALAFLERNFTYLAVAVFPLLIGGAVLYFIVQRVKEIDAEAEKKDEYKKY